MTLAIAALVLSVLLLGATVALLVMLRRGEGPLYGASRAYDENRREAVRRLTGATVHAPPREQWYVPGPRKPIADPELEAAFRLAVDEALAATKPELDGARVVAALSTADLRASDALETWAGPELLIGLVLVNPEPPGGDARRVTLPIQVLFPALERAGRAVLIERFAELHARIAAPPIRMEAS